MTKLLPPKPLVRRLEKQIGPLVHPDLPYRTWQRKLRLCASLTLASCLPLSLSIFLGSTAWWVRTLSSVMLVVGLVTAAMTFALAEVWRRKANRAEQIHNAWWN